MPVNQLTMAMVIEIEMEMALMIMMLSMVVALMKMMTSWISFVFIFCGNTIESRCAICQSFSHLVSGGGGLRIGIYHTHVPNIAQTMTSYGWKDRRTHMPISRCAGAGEFKSLECCNNNLNLWRIHLGVKCC